MTFCPKLQKHSNTKFTQLWPLYSAYFHDSAKHLSSHKTCTSNNIFHLHSQPTNHMQRKLILCLTPANLTYHKQQETSQIPIHEHHSVMTGSTAAIDEVYCSKKGHHYPGGPLICFYVLQGVRNSSFQYGNTGCCQWEVWQLTAYVLLYYLKTKSI